MKKKALFKILGYDGEKDVVVNDQIVGRETLNAILISVYAVTEKEAMSLAGNRVKRKEFIVKEIQEASPASEEIEANYKQATLESQKNGDRQHKDYVQLTSKALVLSERLTLATERIAKLME